MKQVPDSPKPKYKEKKANQNIPNIQNPEQPDKIKDMLYNINKHLENIKEQNNIKRLEAEENIKEHKKIKADLSIIKEEFNT
ncbi:MAG: hypothetical protein U9P44_00005, partial [archaeon]|nr:hypothetical protein [archaeon]